MVKHMHRKLNKLSSKEKKIIQDKETERPFTGKYLDHFENGIYTCRQCDAGLYFSRDKFDSHCGWPNFDDEIEDAITKKQDRDGIRTEIICSTCGAHLGHIFKGENLTSKNVRHCVNSISLNFIPKENIEEAYFAGGCFWGIEFSFQKENYVLFTQAGYAGGDKENPKYEEVCQETTGHAETVRVVFNNSLIPYERLVKRFFNLHDPTEENKQGPDIGEQYRSVIFYTSEEQKKTAEQLIQQLISRNIDIKTEVQELKKFWKAENYHQNYFMKNNKTPVFQLGKNLFNE